jgi:hypothetical protein
VPVSVSGPRKERRENAEMLYQTAMGPIPEAFLGKIVVTVPLAE